METSWIILAWFVGFITPGIFLILAAICLFAILVCIGLYEGLYKKPTDDIERKINAARYN